MYAHLSELILVRSNHSLRPDDSPIFQVPHPTGTLVFTFDATAKDAVRYGIGYFDAEKRLCVVPDAWNSLDAVRAKDWVGELDG